MYQKGDVCTLQASLDISSICRWHTGVFKLHSLQSSGIGIPDPSAGPSECSLGWTRGTGCCLVQWYVFWIPHCIVDYDYDVFMILGSSQIHASKGTCIISRGLEPAFTARLFGAGGSIDKTFHRHPRPMKPIADPGYIGTWGALRGDSYGLCA